MSHEFCIRKGKVAMNTEEPFNVYDPNPEANKLLLSKLTTKEIVCGLLNQIYAARQTAKIENESFQSQLKELHEERDEAVRLLREAFGVLDDSPIYDATEIKEFLSISNPKQPTI